MSSIATREPSGTREESSRLLSKSWLGDYVEIQDAETEAKRIVLVVKVVSDPTHSHVVVFDGEEEKAYPPDTLVRPVETPAELLDTDWLVFRIRRYRYAWQSEKDIQEALRAVLGDAGARFGWEVELGTLGRVDFLVVPGVAIEVKLKTPTSQVIRQLWRYAESDRVKEIILVTTSMTLATTVPEKVRGKRVVAVVVGNVLA